VQIPSYEGATNLEDDQLDDFRVIKYRAIPLALAALMFGVLNLTLLLQPWVTRPLEALGPIAGLVCSVLALLMIHSWLTRIFRLRADAIVLASNLDDARQRHSTNEQDATAFLQEITARDQDEGDESSNDDEYAELLRDARSASNEAFLAAAAARDAATNAEAYILTKEADRTTARLVEHGLSETANLLRRSRQSLAEWVRIQNGQ
jgi:hypothetical protein